MSSLIPLLCVASLAVVAADEASVPATTRQSGLYAGAIEVRHFNFEQKDDADYDGLPDDWSRVRGSGFPHYIKAEIDPNVGRGESRSLRFDADGGNVTYFSPPVAIDFRQSYVLQGTLRVKNLEHDQASISLTFLDSLQRPVTQVESRHIAGTQDWSEIQLGPLVPSDPAARFLVVGCHLYHGTRLDVEGAVWFDDLWIGRLPRMTLSFSEDDFYFSSFDQPLVRCFLSGFEMTDLSVEMALMGAFGETLDEKNERIEADSKMADDVSPGGDPPQEASHSGPLPGEEQTGWKPTEVQWLLRSLPAGFYRVTATLRRGETALLVNHLTFAVIATSPARPTGEFGWSLGKTPQDVDFETLVQLAARARINWLKYPFWFVGSEAMATSSEFLQFVEGLDEGGIALVGLLGDPPRQVRQYLTGGQSEAVDVFRLDPSRWYPSLEPLLARYAMKVRWWQLGNEEDRSFVGAADLAQILGKVKAQLDRVGRDVHLGVPWDWMYPEPEADWDQFGFLSLSSRPTLTDRELAAHLSEPGKVPRWIALSPLPAGAYPIETRATDMVRRMLAAKQAGVDAIFANHPFDPERGLVHENGSPTELFLPWRTVSDLLSSAGYLGSLVLPNGSSNAVFLRDRELILAVWNDQPTDEQLYLGDRISVVDVWGRRREVNTTRGSQRLEVGPLPLFLFGASEEVARWRMATSFSNGEVPSEVGAHQETVRFYNRFSQGVSGTATLVLPEGWSAEPSSWNFQLGADEDHVQNVLIRLPFNASQDTHVVAIDFEVNADRRYQFRVYRSYELGLGDVELEVLNHLTPNGELEIEQRITNDTDEVLSFECLLEAPRRKREKTMVIKLGRGRDTKYYLLSNGRDLIGKTLSLRAKQVGGRRVLNRTFVVGE